jgi:hypothetical protein
MSQYYFVHRKSHVGCLRFDPGPPRLDTDRQTGVRDESKDCVSIWGRAVSMER